MRAWYFFENSILFLKYINSCKTISKKKIQINFKIFRNETINQVSRNLLTWIAHKYVIDNYHFNSLRYIRNGINASSLYGKISENEPQNIILKSKIPHQIKLIELPPTTVLKLTTLGSNHIFWLINQNIQNFFLWSYFWPIKHFVVF